MKNLATLIKLHHHALDTQRKQLVKARENREKILAYSSRLKEEVAQERQLASEDPSLKRVFLAYAGAMDEKQKTVTQTLTMVDKEIEALETMVREGFATVKTYEVLQERQQKDAKKQQEKIEQDGLDEVAARTLPEVEA